MAVVKVPMGVGLRNGHDRRATEAEDVWRLAFAGVQSRNPTDIDDQKQGTDSLADILDAEAVSKLASHWITTIDDLVGALETDEASVGRLLEMTPQAIADLHQLLMTMVSGNMRHALRQERSFSYGAWEPSND